MTGLGQTTATGHKRSFARSIFLPVVRLVAEQENFDSVFQNAAYSGHRIDSCDKAIRSLDAGANSVSK